MQQRDRLPEPFGIDNQPDIVIRMPGPVECRDAIVKRREAQRTIDEAPEMLDEKGIRPTGKRTLERLPRSDGMKQCEQAECGDEGP